MRKLHVQAREWASSNKGRKRGALYQSMLDYPGSCSPVQTRALAFQASVLDILNLLEVLPDPPYFAEGRMLHGVDAIESQIC